MATYQHLRWSAPTNVLDLMSQHLLEIVISVMSKLTSMDVLYMNPEIISHSV
jgi:hypothetical protein